MLSRLSSFSGPLSKLFTSIKDFTLDGLILRYEISNRNSYSGPGTSSVTDLVSSSNATLYNGPTYSINGYINFDGNNDYLITNTSLNSKLSPPNTSTVISYFMWVYPTDNGVILSEQGTSTLNLNWYDSQVEMVSGVMKFRIYAGSIVTSSISTPLYNWYYVGLSYNGSVVSAYINGQFAGSASVSRQTPYNNNQANPSATGLFYALAGSCSTSLGDGTYAKMKLGAFHVYNSALSQQQVLNNYNSTKSNYIVTSTMSIWIDANDPESYPGTGTSLTDLSGNGYTHTLGASVPVVTSFGFKSFDCNGSSNNYIRVNGTGPILPTTGYTYVTWARVKSDSSGWRTLYRSNPSDHAILVELGSDRLGFYDNNTNAFYPSGYDVTSIEEKWVQYSVVGDSSSSIFYINDIQVGSVSFGAGGNNHDYFGAIDGQAFGYIGNMMLYNKKLTQTEIKQNYDALRNVYSNGNFVVNNLVLYYNPSSNLSYIGTGLTVSNLVTNSLNGTTSNTSFTYPYFSLNGTNSTISVADNSSLEPGSGDFTIEIWVNYTSFTGSSRVIIAKTDGGLSSQWGYGIRTSSSGDTYIEIGDGANSLRSTGYVVTTNTWYQLVGVINNTSNLVSLYVNGSIAGTASNAYTSIRNTTSPLYIGSFNNGQFSQWFNGKVGIVRLYNSALSATDISTNFEANRGLYGI